MQLVYQRHERKPIRTEQEDAVSHAENTPFESANQCHF